MILTIISHTPHYSRDGIVYGWGATVREVNYMKSLFDKIYHVAPLHKGPPSGSDIPYDDGIEFVPLEPVGGAGFRAKWGIIRSILPTLRTIAKTLGQSTHFHFRAPTSIGLFVIPYLLIINRKPGWFKYAGNWMAKNAPASYVIQRFFLTNQNKFKVTINGSWPRQKRHLLSFENPCLTEVEVERGKVAAGQKDFTRRCSLLYVGNLSQAKGVDLLILAVQGIPGESVEEINLIGNGDREYFESLVSNKTIKINFVGAMNRSEINAFYEKAHVLLLTSLSEGFPKVVAEGAAFGCVPAVSDVSSVSQYINGSNGLVFSGLQVEVIRRELVSLLSNRNEMKNKSAQAVKLATRFTYSYYLNRLQNEVLLR